MHLPQEVTPSFRPDPRLGGEKAEKCSYYNSSSFKKERLGMPERTASSTVSLVAESFLLSSVVPLRPYLADGLLSKFDDVYFVVMVTLQVPGII
eukprot:m.132713 g.132713  ORF g.132713 m.132713 type:complete len:94 (+) comp38084_c0_seq14:1919-2200(+)